MAEEPKIYYKAEVIIKLKNGTDTAFTLHHYKTHKEAEKSCQNYIANDINKHLKFLGYRIVEQRYEKGVGMTDLNTEFVRVPQRKNKSSA